MLKDQIRLWADIDRNCNTFFGGINVELYVDKWEECGLVSKPVWVHWVDGQSSIEPVPDPFSNETSQILSSPSIMHMRNTLIDGLLRKSMFIVYTEIAVVCKVKSSCFQQESPHSMNENLLLNKEGHCLMNGNSFPEQGLPMQLLKHEISWLIQWIFIQSVFSILLLDNKIVDEHFGGVRGKREKFKGPSQGKKISKAILQDIQCVELVCT